MGVGASDLGLLIHLKSQGHIPDGCSVIEIGAQQLNDSFLSSREALETARRLFGIELPCSLPRPFEPPALDRLPSLNAAAPFARDFWTWLGIDYAAIDVDGSPGSIPLDLNFDEPPSEFHGKYHLVTNFGTTEHVANQLHAFKVIHDLTAVGGVMIHNVPAQGMFNHGLINYNPKFFLMLARSNNYRILYMDFTVSSSVHSLTPSIVDYISAFVPKFAERAAGYRASNCGLGVVMQKVKEIPFIPPLDVPAGARIDNDILIERYWTVFNYRRRIIGAMVKRGRHFISLLRRANAFIRGR
jgi:hypothetical protein